MKYHVIVVPGLIRRKRYLKKTKLFKSEIIKAEAFDIAWFSKKKTYIFYRDKLAKKIESIPSEDKIVLIGNSGGGSFVLNTFYKNKDKIHKVILVCAPVRTKESIRLILAKRQSKIFGTSLKLCEKRVKKLSKKDRKKIITVIPNKDELVDLETMKVKGAKKIFINTVEHLIGIKVTFTKHSDTLIKNFD